MSETLRAPVALSDGQPLDVLLLNPCLDWKIEHEKKIAMRLDPNIPNQESPHIGIAYLLAVAKQAGLRVKYLDMLADCLTQDGLLDYIAQTKPRLLGMTAFTVQIRTAGAIAQVAKSRFPELPICVGGPHVSAIPKETLDEFPDIDFVVCGEGEYVLLKMVRALEQGEDISRIRGIASRDSTDTSWDPIENLDALPFPAWEEFDLSRYPGNAPHRTRLELPVVAARGCPYRCTFCCRALGGKTRQRSVASVIAEIEHNIERFRCESICFLDETFTVNRRWTREFLDTMIAKGLNRKVTWTCSTGVRNVSAEILRQMREAGCYYIFFGIESADDNTLQRIKKVATVQQIRDAVRGAKQAGIVPVGAFIIGLPGDTEREVLKDIDLADELDLYSVTFPIAVPFPGTELHAMAMRNEFGMQILSNNWDHYGKQGYGVLESDALPWARRKELQKAAYTRHPKKQLAAYIERLSETPL